MIDHVGNVSLFVSDQDRAKDFYTRILGFELRPEGRRDRSGLIFAR